MVNTNTIIYYGIDFSNARLTNPKKVVTANKLRKYFPAWIADFDQDYELEHRVKKYMKKDDFIYSASDVQKRYESVIEDWVLFEDYSMGIEKVESSIKSYSLQEKSGVGFVINIENFNKRADRGTMFISFFDIKTRDILWSVEMFGKPGGFGMTTYWTSSIKQTMDKFFDLYRKRSKEVRKGLR